LKFPFFITNHIIFKQPEQKITSDRYILNQIESRLERLDMIISRISENELFLRKMVFVRTMRKKDLLRNLKVVVQTNDSTIQITLITETIFFFLIGLIPLIAFFFRDQNFTITFLLTSSFFYWSVGFLSKFLVMRNIKKDVENYLKRINNLD
jgi:hypothetical protein